MAKKAATKKEVTFADGEGSEGEETSSELADESEKEADMKEEIVKGKGKKRAADVDGAALTGATTRARRGAIALAPAPAKKAKMDINSTAKGKKKVGKSETEAKAEVESEAEADVEVEDEDKGDETSEE